MAEEWLGVDLDGTLAHYRAVPDWDGSIGAPIPAMVERVKKWIASGRDVRIVTARVAFVAGVTDGPRSVEAQRALVQAWCREHLGVELPVTCGKDYHMTELWDDRVVQVVTNTGVPLVVPAMRAEFLARVDQRQRQCPHGQAEWCDRCISCVIDEAVEELVATRRGTGGVSNCLS